MSGSPGQATPKLCYQPTETWGKGVVLSLLDTGRVPTTLPFEASRFVLEPGATSPEDVHSVPEIWLIASGSGRLLYGGAAYPMTAGDIFHMHPGTVHQAENTSTEALEIFSIWWSM